MTPTGRFPCGSSVCRLRWRLGSAKVMRTPDYHFFPVFFPDTWEFGL
jgi:hypothetical protein